MAAILDKDGADGHNFERGPPKDHLEISSNGQNCSILSQKVRQI
jgi:hypothetical protein